MLRRGFAEEALVRRSARLTLREACVPSLQTISMPTAGPVLGADSGASNRHKHWHHKRRPGWR